MICLTCVTINYQLSDMGYTVGPLTHLLVVDDQELVRPEVLQPPFQLVRVQAPPDVRLGVRARALRPPGAFLDEHVTVSKRTPETSGTIVRKDIVM